MFFIRIKLKGYLKNISENKIENIEEKAIKKDNTIKYKNNGTNYKIMILDNKIVLSRDNEEFSHELIFEATKEYTTEYYIKELNTSINIRIKTTKLEILDNQIKINYEIVDSNQEYIYLIEMSE